MVSEMEVEGGVIYGVLQKNLLKGILSGFSLVFLSVETEA